MEHDGNKAVARNGEEALAAGQHISSARPPVVALGRASSDDRSRNTALEALWCRVLEGDQQAWAEVEQCLIESVRSWLDAHSGKEAACRTESAEELVSLTFE